MLARPDRLPCGDWSYEVKWDGFRAIVSTENGLEMRSRRGWPMADRLPELARLPTGLVLDGELVAFGLDGRPSFHLLGLRVLHGRDAIPVTLMVFDVLRVEGLDTMLLPRPSGARCSRRSSCTARRGARPKRSTTARRYSRRRPSSASKASSRSAGASATGRASAAGSRRSTAATGASRRSLKGHCGGAGRG